MKKLVVLILLLCIGFPLQAKIQKPSQPYTILVKSRPDSKGEERDAIISANGGKLEKIIKNVDIRVISFPSKTSANNALKGIRRSAGVVFAEENRILAPEIIPNDPEYPSQWHLPAINAASAWDITVGSQDIIIAILDTGVYPHPEFASKMVAGTNTNDGSTDTSDVFGHGTKVAGVAVAIGNNASQVAGIAWGCRIMPVRVSGADGNASYSSISEGLIWAADNGARVANISYDASLSSAVSLSAQYFQDHDGVVVISAGNNGQTRSVAGNVSLLTVSGTNFDGTPASFSNKGSNIDLAAPAVGVLTTAVGGGTTAPSGTSFSAPIVAGVAGLLLSLNPNLSGLDAKLTLRQSGIDNGAAGWDGSYGAGIISAFSALQPKTLDYPPTCIITSHVNGERVRNTETIEISYNDDLGVVRAELYVQGALVSSSTTAPFNTFWDVKSISDGSYPVQMVVYDVLHNAGLSQILNLVKR